MAAGIDNARRLALLDIDSLRYPNSLGTEERP
jgi:hypothetical protein